MHNDEFEFKYDIEEKLKAFREIRMDAGYSQKEVADLLGIDQSRVSRWERGEWMGSQHVMTLIHLCRLIDHMQLILQGKEKKE